LTRRGPQSAPKAAAYFFEGLKLMPNEHCVIVHASGRQLDSLRGEAFRIAKASKQGWSTDRAEVGTRFCFEDASAKNAFAIVCNDFGILSKQV
jgi:hypothetical protein